MIALFRRKAVRCGYRIGVAYPPTENGQVRLAKSDRRLGQRIEHRLQVEGRAADHLEHVGCSRLLLQRLAQVVGALAQLVEQPRVFDRDDGLSGKILNKIDVLLLEGPHLTRKIMIRPITSSSRIIGTKS